MKVTYWVAVCRNDSCCYNIRTATKKRCLELIESYGGSDEWDAPQKHTINYKSGLDLVQYCLSEDRAGEPSRDI